MGIFVLAISWREKKYIQNDDGDDVHFVLEKRAWLKLLSANALRQQSTGKHYAPHGHIVMIPI